MPETISFKVTYNKKAIEAAAQHMGIEPIDVLYWLLEPTNEELRPNIEIISE